MNAKLMALVAAGGLAISASMASAVQLVKYSFEGANASDGTAGGTSPADTGSVSNGTAGGFGLGSSIVERAGTNDYRADGFDNTVAWQADQYFSFTFTPNVQMNFNSLTFTTQRIGGNTAKDFHVRSSLTGTADLQTWAQNDTSNTKNPRSVTITDSALQNVASGTAVTFYIFGQNSGSTSADVGIDDVILSGTPVPEPAALGLLGLGVTALLRRRA